MSEANLGNSNTGNSNTGNSNIAKLKLPPALNVFFGRHLTAHRLMLLLATALFLIAWNRGLAMLYGLFSFLVAMLILSYGLPLWQLRKLRAQVQVVGNFRVGQEGIIHCQLCAAGTRQHLIVELILPFATDPDIRFFFSHVDNQAAQSKPLLCATRGTFLLTQVRVLCFYPFGIFGHSKTLAITPVEFLVLPAIANVPYLPPGRMGDNPHLGSIFTQHMGGLDEFAAIRDYRPGDELRYVHWLATARKQGLVVKEHEHTNQTQLLIVLNATAEFNVGEGQNSSFEMAIRLVAGLALLATQQGISCCVFTRDVDTWHLVLPAYNTDLYPLHEQLARLQGVSREPYGVTLAEAITRYASANLLLTFRTDADPVPEAHGRATHMDLVMDTKSFRFPAQHPQRQLMSRQGNRLSYLLTASTRLEELFR